MKRILTNQMIGSFIHGCKVIETKWALVAWCCNLSCETLLFGRMEHRLLVWFNPDHFKGNLYYAWYLCIHSTTQPLHQGTGKAGKMSPEDSLAVAGCGVQVQVPIPERAVRFSCL